MYVISICNYFSQILYFCHIFNEFTNYICVVIFTACYSRDLSK